MSPVAEIFKVITVMGWQMRGQPGGQILQKQL